MFAGPKTRTTGYPERCAGPGSGPTHHQLTLYTRPSTARSLATTRTLIEGASDRFRARICAWRRAEVRNMSTLSAEKMAIPGQAVKTSNNGAGVYDNLRKINSHHGPIVPASGTIRVLSSPNQGRNFRQICPVSRSRTLCHPMIFLPREAFAGRYEAKTGLVLRGSAAESTPALTGCRRKPGHPRAHRRLFASRPLKAKRARLPAKDPFPSTATRRCEAVPNSLPSR